MRAARLVLALLVSASFLAAFAPVAFAQASTAGDLPAFGDYVYVEELPEKIENVAPVYPQIAREAGVEGTVMVQALVDKTGRVVDTRVVKSIPMLDQAAVECVRRWRFKPALSNGRPVAIWVGCPVRFALAGEPAGGLTPPREAVVPITPTERPEPRFRAAPPRDGSIETPGFGTGHYYMNDDPSALLIVTELDGQRVKLESPGQWDGVGMLDGDTYWGVFTYRDNAPDPRNHGARGTHLGTIDPTGRVHVEGKFTNRQWAPFTVVWAPGASQEHPRAPKWPPEWFTGDTRLLLDERMPVDTPPRVLRRVEPRVTLPGDGASALVVVRVRIERDGKVSDATIARSVPAIDEGVLQAVRRWAFRPAVRRGRAVAVSAFVPVRVVRR